MNQFTEGLNQIMPEAMRDVTLAAAAGSVFLVLIGAIFASILFENWHAGRRQKRRHSLALSQSRLLPGQAIFREEQSAVVS